MAVWAVLPRHGQRGARTEVTPELLEAAVIVAMFCLWILAGIAYHEPEVCNDPNHRRRQ